MSEFKEVFNMNICLQLDKSSRGNLAYQERQKQRRNYLEKKRALRRTFEFGKLMEKVGFPFKDSQ